MTLTTDVPADQVAAAVSLTKGYRADVLPDYIAEDVRAIFDVNDTLGEPVGFRPVYGDTDPAPCDAGCLAPGSSAHSHRIPTAYELIGTRGFVEVATADHDRMPAGVPYRIGTVHPFTVATLV